MTEESHPAFKINGTLTLPLFIHRAKILEQIVRNAAGDFTLDDFAPHYDVPAISIDTVRSFDTDPKFALELVAGWRGHCSDFAYFVQFSDQQLVARYKALRIHTDLISSHCDLRLSIDPTGLHQAVDALLTFQFIHSSFRKDDQRDLKRADYVARLRPAFEAFDLRRLDAMKLLARISDAITLRAAVWATLPPVLSSSANLPAVDEDEGDADTQVIDLREKNKQKPSQFVADMEVQAPEAESFDRRPRPE